MGLQVLVEAQDVSAIHKALGEATQRCEVFPVSGSLFGISVPTRVVDEIGEKALQRRLAALRRFDLWQGQWSKPKASWWPW